MDLLLRESGGGFRRRWVRSRTDASRCLISLRYLWPDNPRADRFPQPPYPPLDVVGSGLLCDKRD